MYDSQVDPDLIKFENVDICDPKYVEGPKYRHRRSTIFVTFADKGTQIQPLHRNQILFKDPLQTWVEGLDTGFKSFILIPSADPTITLVDVEKMMETGMNVARFKTSHSTKGDKVKLLKKFDKAATFLARKHGILDWPCATCVELKTCVVNTGILEEDVSEITIRENTEIILTCDVQLFNKCNERRIFVDNPYLTLDVKVGMEVNIGQDEITTTCTAILNDKTITCFVTKGGQLQNMAYVCMRGAVRHRPYLTKTDLHLIKFAIEYQVDMIIINYARHIDTLKRIKRYLGTKLRRPIILTGVSTEQGLATIDDFLRESDGVLLSREFLTYEVTTPLYDKMGRIQSVVAAKCRQAGKPLYLSGGIFHDALLTGVFHGREFSDVTNAILQGVSGFVLRETPNVDYLIEVMKTMNDLCSSVEPLTNDRAEFYRMVSQLKIPLNAAESCAISCVFIANQTNARVIVVPTVTGRTAYLLNWLKPASIVIAVTTRISTVRILHTQRGIIPLLYRGAPYRTWFRTVQARVHYAIQHAVEKHWIEYGDHYVTLEKGTEVSSFCDAVRVWNVTITKKNTVECPESYHDFAVNDYVETISGRKKSLAIKKQSVIDVDTRDLDTILEDAMRRGKLEKD